MIPIADRPRKIQPQGIAVSAGILLVGLWMTWFNLGGVWRARNWDSWKEARGTVIDSSVHGRGGGRRVTCEYSYTVDGQLYTNDVVTLMSGDRQYGGGTAAGTPVTVHYDPANPRNSALGRGNPLNSWLWGIVGLVVLLFGAILVLVGFFPGRLPKFISAEDPHDPGEPA